MENDTELSFTSETGYYGLRVNPTFDEVLKTIRKPLRIPLPDRSAKWYANSPYRSLLLDAEQKHNSYEHAALDYNNSGAELPRHAAMVRPSPGGEDESFGRIDAHHHAMAAQEAYDAAKQVSDATAKLETEKNRQVHLSRSSGPNAMNPVVIAHHAGLEEAGVPHYMPAPRFPPPPRGHGTETRQMMAEGQPQPVEFETFETLNLGQPSDLRPAQLEPGDNEHYEELRASSQTFP
jgi:hypothetical protein